MVVEVGLLGRFDSTNVGRADVAVITNVGRDHTDGTGDWRAGDRRGEGGHHRAGSAVIIGETDPELVDDLPGRGRRRCTGSGTSTSEPPGPTVAVGGRQVDLFTPNGPANDIFLPVHGAHQVDNAAIALAAVEAFFDRRVDPRRRGAAPSSALELPGRFEVVRPPAAASSSTAPTTPTAPGRSPRTVQGEFTVAGDATLVIGMLGGRDLDDVVAALLDVEPLRVVCTQPDSPRAVPADELAAIVRRLRP